MNYVTEVANLFLSRCDHIKILSPADYATIAEWEKEEIPIAIIIDSLNSGFDDIIHNIEPIKIESIGYFQNEVKKNFAEWLYSFKGFS